MKKRGFIKQGMAIALTGAVAVSAVALLNGNTYAADAIDLTKTCSLTVEVEAGSQYEADLDSMIIPVDIYKVADVNVSGAYTELPEFAGIGLDSVSDATTADQWLTMAETAAGMLTDAAEPDASIEVIDGMGSAAGLEAGMYLIVPEDTYNGDYSWLYQFTPYLTALPGNDYYNSGDDTWLYDVTIGLKVEREMQYGALKINKHLLDYNNLTQEGYFVFSIEGEKDGVVYSNVAAIEISETGSGTAYVDHIPVGMEVTVTEIYSGGSYEPVGPVTATAVIVADQIVEVRPEEGAEVDFENDYDDKLIPGTGVLNQFHAPEDGGDWSWDRAGGYDQVQ